MWSDPTKKVDVCECVFLVCAYGEMQGSTCTECNISNLKAPEQCLHKEEDKPENL